MLDVVLVDKKYNFTIIAKQSRIHLVFGFYFFKIKIRPLKKNLNFILFVHPKNNLTHTHTQKFILYLIQI